MATGDFETIFPRSSVSSDSTVPPTCPDPSEAPRYCVICATDTNRDANGDCLTCAFWNRLHRMTGTVAVPMCELIDPIMSALSQRTDVDLDRCIGIAAGEIETDDSQIDATLIVDYLTELLPKGVTFPAACRSIHLVQWRDWRAEVQATRERVYGIEAA